MGLWPASSFPDFGGSRVHRGSAGATVPVSRGTRSFLESCPGSCLALGPGGSVALPDAGPVSWGPPAGPAGCSGGLCGFRSALIPWD